MANKDKITCPVQYSVHELQSHSYYIAMKMVHERALEIARWEQENRYAPKLPDGYEIREGSSVYDLWHNGVLLAWFTFGGNLELTDEGAKGKHAQALAIWLQRRAR